MPRIKQVTIRTPNNVFLNKQQTPHQPLNACKIKIFEVFLVSNIILLMKTQLWVETSNVYNKPKTEHMNSMMKTKWKYISNCIAKYMVVKQIHLILMIILTTFQTHYQYNTWYVNDWIPPYKQSRTNFSCLLSIGTVHAFHWYQVWVAGNSVYWTN